MEQLIKSKRRVQDHGEVFTPFNIVSDMLDMVKDGFTSVEKTVLEPACGNGNFLVQILSRKLKVVDVENYERDVFISISSIYGIDIQDDNVLESRERLFEIVQENYLSVRGIEIPDTFAKIIVNVLEKNIILGNTLTDRMLKLSNDGVATGDILTDRIVLYSWVLSSSIVSNETIKSTSEFLFNDKKEEKKEEKFVAPVGGFTNDYFSKMF